MDIQAIKLDLINWLTDLQDEKVISLLKTIKDDRENDLDTLLENNASLQKLLDNRLQEDPADYENAQTSLANIREQYGL